MPQTITNVTGGEGKTLLECSIELPDSGTTVKVTGIVAPAGSAQEYKFEQATVTIPATPGAGETMNYIIQVNTENGALSVKENAAEMPAPDEHCVAILKQTLVHASTDPAQTGESTPDEPVVS